MEHLSVSDGFVIAEVSKEKDVNWKEYLVPNLLREDKLQTLIDNIFFKSANEIDESPKEIPHWFKTRALLWSERSIGDQVFIDGIENLVRTGVIPLD